MSWSLADLLAVYEYQTQAGERARVAAQQAEEDAMREKQLGLQKQKIAEFENLLTRGAEDPRAFPMYSPLFSQGKENLENQFTGAKETVLAGPRGGNMMQGLTDLETSRAETSGSLPAMISSSLVGDMMNQAYGTAFGASPAPVMPANLQPMDTFFGGVASKEIQDISDKARENQMYYGGLGSLASLMLMKPWGNPKQNTTGTNPMGTSWNTWAGW